jgi:5'-nucleotidase
MNPGGIRAPLNMPADGQLRYENLFAVQPFYNNLVTLTLTGAQLLQVLEQQWAGQPSAAGPRAAGEPRLQLHLGRQPPAGPARAGRQPEARRQARHGPDTLRVTVNSFLASGGDNFTALKQGRDARTGMMDIDALEAFVKANPTLAPGLPDRVTRLN